MPKLMSSFINLLDHQKKREKLVQIDLPAGKKNTLWYTIKAVEDQAQDLYDQITAMLPKQVSLKRSGLEMQNYKTPRVAAKLHIRAQISATNHRSYVLRIHCHELNPKGNLDKVARAEYTYVEERRAI